jgi:hypothetical protein
LTDAELLTDTDVVGADADLVTVRVVPGAVAVSVLVSVAAADPDSVVVPGSDFAGPVALEIAWLAFWAALETAPLVAPDPHALSGTVAIPSASAPSTSGTRLVRIILGRLGRRGPRRLRRV